MPKLQITDPNLLAFCKSLAAMVKEHPALNLDLSDPVHCGMIRMLDVALARTGEKFPVDRDFPLYDAAPGNNPFDVTESYAMMPKDESGVYITPAPDGDENDIAWLADNQQGFSVSGNTVPTELSE